MSARPLTHVSEGSTRKSTHSKDGVNNMLALTHTADAHAFIELGREKGRFGHLAGVSG